MRKIFSPLNVVVFLLTEAIAVSLAWNILPAFRINSALSEKFWLILFMTAVPLVLLHLSFYPKPRIATFVVLAIWLIGIGALFAGIYATRDTLFHSGRFESQTLFFILLPMLAILGYVASRFRLGLLLLLPGGVLVFAWFTLLKYQTSWIALVVFACCAMLLLALQFFNRTIEYSHAKQTKILAFMLSPFVFCLICLSITGGVYKIVSTQATPVQRLNLLSNANFKNLGVKWGFATLVQTPMKNHSPQQTFKQQTPSQELQQRSPNTITNSAALQSSPNPTNNPGGQKTRRKARPITYFFHWPVLLIALSCVLFALFLFYLSKALWRRHWYKQLKQLAPDARIAALYCYILHIIAVFEEKPQSGQTLREYVNELDKRRVSLAFDIAAFSRTTTVFSQVRFGHKPLVQAAYEDTVTFSRNLFKCFRKKMNIFRFGWKYLFV